MTMGVNPKYASIARPYALAAFEYAREHNALSDWKTFLDSAALTAKNADVTKLLDNPEVSVKTLSTLFHEVLSSLLDTERKNFLSLLAEHHRFVALPEIAALFNAYYAALEKMSSVHVVTAIAVDDAFKQKLMQSLAKRTHKEVTLHYEVDPSIIGGAIVRIGDRVIDGSVFGKLTRLLEFSLR